MKIEGSKSTGEKGRVNGEKEKMGGGKFRRKMSKEAEQSEEREEEVGV